MKKWEILNDRKPKNKEEVIDFLLQNRGIGVGQKNDFLNPTLSNINPKSVGIDEDEIGKTLKRIESAIKRNEKIIVYGDYDVDGITGTAILWETLYKSYKNVMPFIPHRIEEGYGISKKGIDNILTQNPDAKLIITVDNGIVANEAVDYAMKMGIDVIITDHHVSASILPKSYSIIHTTNLCGAGVAYLLSLAFEKKECPDSKDDRLSLVALATIADLVPLINANRALVKYGMDMLAQSRRPGLIALFFEGGIKPSEIDTYKIGHIIAPRLNAAGRIGHAMDALRLICTKDAQRAKELARLLSMTNKERQALTQDGALLADKISSEILIDSDFIVVHDKSYNEGIIGLVASRIVEKHYRPAIVISEGATYSKGSARSISGFNIIEFIREHKEFLVDAGGHPMAAGFTIETLNIEAFKESIVKSSKKILSKELLDRKLKIDMEVDLNLINESLHAEMQKLAPFGMGNPEPVFVSRNLKVHELKTLGKEKNHIKLKINDEEMNTLEALYFRGAESGIGTENKIDIVFSVNLNEWNGARKIQALVKDTIILGQ